MQGVPFFAEILTHIKMQISFHFLVSTILVMAFGMLHVIANEKDGWIFKKVLTGSCNFCNHTFSVYSCKYKMD